jgi:hypothetical protein
VLLPLQLFGQKHLEKRSVGNVALIGQHLQVLDHCHGQPHRDGAQSGLEVNELYTLGVRPIDVFCRVPFGPEFKLRALVF